MRFATILCSLGLHKWRDKSCTRCGRTWTKEEEHKAIRKMLGAAGNSGYVSTVTRMLRFGLSVDTQDEESGFTALIVAGLGGAHFMTQMLLLRGADVNVQAKTGDTALIAAARGGYGESESNRGHANVIKLLLDRDDIDVNASDMHGNTALMFACKHAHLSPDHTDVVSLLLKKGAKVDVTNHNGETALMFASLVENKWNVSGITFDGIELYNASVVQLLLEGKEGKGARLN